jgi:hypothetical protein
MPPSVDGILATQKGLVVAPAGCGKTQLIVEILRSPSKKPSLVLTHTTAGVAALRHRLNQTGVPRHHYKLATIAGWALNVLGMFPERTGYTLDPLGQPKYAEIQRIIGRLCASAHIDDLMKASYSRLLIDEYQDCSISQHSIAFAISRAIPTIVFGDPMQAVFGFDRRDPLPSWNDVVCRDFPIIGELTVPWRWNNAGAHDLGRWFLAVRAELLAGQKIDLRTGGARVQWVALTGNDQENIQNQVNAQRDITRHNSHETLLIVGDSINVSSRHNYARNARGVTVVEPVDLRDVVSRAKSMEGLRGNELLMEAIEFLRNVMVNVYGDQLLRRVTSVMRGTNRNPPTEQEIAALQLANNGGYREAVHFLKAMRQDRNRRIYRGSAFSAMFEALRTAATHPEKGLQEIAAAIREQRRHAGRKIQNKAVGSTLLLKGLEADHVLILDAGKMDARHLYVALSRGAKSVTVFSQRPILP